jgi:hypothetical protein
MHPPASRDNPPKRVIQKMGRRFAPNIGKNIRLEGKFGAAGVIKYD